MLGVLSVLPLLLRGHMLRAAMLLPVAAGVAFTLLAIATRLADDTVSGRTPARLRVLARASPGFAGYSATVCEMSAMRTRYGHPRGARS